MPFIWTSNCNAIFRRLKHTLTTAPVLVIPECHAPCGLMTDSCGYGLGALLMQYDKPVAFYSNKMSSAEPNYINHEQELFAATTALSSFCCDLMGNKSTLVTDNMPNTYLHTQPTLSRRQARRSEYLQRFCFIWVHLRARTSVADPLSRNPLFRLADMAIAKVASRVISWACTQQNCTNRNTMRSLCLGRHMCRLPSGST